MEQLFQKKTSLILPFNIPLLLDRRLNNWDANNGESMKNLIFVVILSSFSMNIFAQGVPVKKLQSAIYDCEDTSDTVIRELRCLKRRLNRVILNYSYLGSYFKCKAFCSRSFPSPGGNIRIEGFFDDEDMAYEALSAECGNWGKLMTYSSPRQTIRNANSTIVTKHPGVCTKQ